ncbi:hypothetical protein [Salmonella sp. C3300]|uniref:hypothetical protein n=1 Tax=Salmonella sp. C3300 TaxID=2947394 RepID=UPI003F4788E6
MVDDKPMRIGWVFYFPYIFVAIIFHLFISFCYCLSIDMAEANTVVFLLKAEFTIQVQQKKKYSSTRI